MMPSTQSSKKAFALSLVLWIVAALLFGAATLALLSKDTLTLTKGVKEKLHTKMVANDVFEALKFYVMTADYDNNSLYNSALENFKYKFPKHLIVDGREYKLSKNIEISVTDTSMLVNVLTASAESIAYLATSPSQTQLRYTIEDSLKDWRDKDNVVRLNGAEASRYDAASLSYTIRNANAVQNPEELKLVNGFRSMSPEAFNTFSEKLYYGVGSPANLALVDSKHLAYILALDATTAQTLVAIREENLLKFIMSVRHLKIFDDELMGLHLSKQFRVKIKVSSENATTLLRVIIDFQKRNNRLYTIISYIIV